MALCALDVNLVRIWLVEGRRALMRRPSSGRISWFIPIAVEGVMLQSTLVYGPNGG